ncbi:hypothetical protein AGLY_012949 [Aphis glycines]|uniref:Uncharacterized protein n=1 Tax=Aphis glycines TaxID=307491 RepID=A0A6G0T799_APHGL|nr:hypothetical protein AGLY_012949 [Aphis glycines]
MKISILLTSCASAFKAESFGLSRTHRIEKRQSSKLDLLFVTQIYRMKSEVFINYIEALKENNKYPLKREIKIIDEIAFKDIGSGAYSERILQGEGTLNTILLKTLSANNAFYYQKIIYISPESTVGGMAPCPPLRQYRIVLNVLYMFINWVKITGRTLILGNHAYDITTSSHCVEIWEITLVQTKSDWVLKNAIHFQKFEDYSEALHRIFNFFFQQDKSNIFFFQQKKT